VPEERPDRHNAGVSLGGKDSLAVFAEEVAPFPTAAEAVAAKGHPNHGGGNPMQQQHGLAVEQIIEIVFENHDPFADTFHLGHQRVLIRGMVKHG
jgi:hypothetical protein